MIKTSAEFFSRIMQRWLPDAFIIAVLLTFLVFILGLVVQEQTPVAMAEHWGNGFWKLLAFSMQMVLILLLGSILAISQPIKLALDKISLFARSPFSAILLVTLVSMLAAWINWGFGLVVGALVAKRVALRVKKVHFPLLIASAYSGMLIWHSGLSGSIPLKLASVTNDALGSLMQGQSIPLSQTIFAWQNVVIIALIVITVPLINWLMMPEENDRISANFSDEPVETIDHHLLTPAEKLEHSPLINYGLIAIGSLYLYTYFSKGQSANLNLINLCLLLAGLAAHKNPYRYLGALKQTVATSSGVILQFPIYAGLMGMMVGSGLAANMSEWFVEISNEKTFPVFTFLSAGIVNFFVPSGGGQWAVQAPIVIPAANALNVPLNQAAMAVAWGDAWTNLIQPFWALPLLAIAGLNLRQIMGYCTILLIWSGLLITSCIYFLY